jgi:hypothetical protein
MTVRPYRPEDREAVEALRKRHDESLWFAHPEDPTNPVAMVAVDDDGTIVGCMVGRATVEAFLILDNGWKTPVDRWAMIRELVHVGGKACHEMGFREAHMGVPSRMAKYARRLSREADFFLQDRFWLIMSLWRRFGSEKSDEQAAS